MNMRTISNFKRVDRNAKITINKTKIKSLAQPRILVSFKIKDIIPNFFLSVVNTKKPLRRNKLAPSQVMKTNV